MFRSLHPHQRVFPRFIVHTLYVLILIHCFALVYLAPLCSTASVPHYLFRQFFIRLQFCAALAVHRGFFYSGLVFVCYYSLLPVVVSRFSFKALNAFQQAIFLCFSGFAENWIIAVKTTNGLLFAIENTFRNRFLKIGARFEIQGFSFNNF